MHTKSACRVFWMSWSGWQRRCVGDGRIFRRSTIRSNELLESRLMTNEQHNKYIAYSFFGYVGFQLFWLLVMGLFFAFFFRSIPSNPGDPGPPFAFFGIFFVFMFVFQLLFT